MFYQEDSDRSRKGAGRTHKKGTPPQKEQKIFYDCECGKRYEAFPGLYLHFKRKHNLRISSHPHGSTIDIHKTPFSTVITYFFSRNHASTPENVVISGEDFYTKIKLIIDECVKSINGEKKEAKIATMALDKFCLFLIEDEENLKGRGENQLLEDLPNTFNNFFMKEVSRKCLTPRNFEEWRNTFILLSEWLNKKGYSQLITKKNRQFILPE